MRFAIGTHHGQAWANAARAGRPTRSLCRVVVVSLSVVLSATAAGCAGGVGRGGASTGAATPQLIAFASPAIAGGRASGAGQTIPVRYTCDGTDTTPSFNWGQVPANTAELVLFLLKVGRAVSTSGGGGVQATVEWAVAGLSPSLHAISAGKLPHGVVVASQRYSICPAKGDAGTYVFQIDALSNQIALEPSFNATRLFAAVEGVTVASGTFTSSYKRT
jgi:phosphatidylethanolamine-binding protein (PEBP) family uncharacterized protein